MRHQIVGGTTYRPRNLEEPRTHPNAAGVALVDVDRRRAGMWRANLGMGTQITGVTHQKEAGDLAEHVGYPLQPALHRGTRKLAGDLRRNLQPEGGGMELLFRKTDRPGADVLVAMEAEFLEDGGQRPDLNFTVMDGHIGRWAAGERLQDFDADGQVGIGVVVDLDRPDVRLLLLPIQPVDVVLGAFVEVYGFFMQIDLGRELVHLADDAGAAR